MLYAALINRFSPQDLWGKPSFKVLSVISIQYIKRFVKIFLQIPTKSFTIKRGTLCLHQKRPARNRYRVPRRIFICLRNVVNVHYKLLISIISGIVTADKSVDTANISEA